MATKKQQELLLSPAELVIEKNLRFLSNSSANDITQYDAAAVEAIRTSYQEIAKSGDTVLNLQEIAVEKKDDGTYTVVDGCTRALVFRTYYDELCAIHNQPVFLKAVERSMSKRDQLLANGARANWPYYVIAKHIADDPALGKVIAPEGKYEEYKLIAKALRTNVRWASLFEAIEFEVAHFFAKQDFSVNESDFLLSVWHKHGKPKMTKAQAGKFLESLCNKIVEMKPEQVKEFLDILQVEGNTRLSAAVFTPRGQKNLEGFVRFRFLCESMGGLYNPDAFTEMCRLVNAHLATVKGVKLFDEKLHKPIDCGAPFSFNVLKIVDHGQSFYYTYQCVITRQEDIEQERLANRASEMQQQEGWRFEEAASKHIARAILEGNEAALAYVKKWRNKTKEESILEIALANYLRDSVALRRQTIKHVCGRLSDEQRTAFEALLQQIPQEEYVKEEDRTALEDRISKHKQKYNDRLKKQLDYVFYKMPKDSAFFTKAAMSLQEKQYLRRLFATPNASEQSLLATIAYLRQQDYRNRELEAAQRLEDIMNELRLVWKGSKEFASCHKLAKALLQRELPDFAWELKEGKGRKALEAYLYEHIKNYLNEQV